MIDLLEEAKAAVADTMPRASTMNLIELRDAADEICVKLRGPRSSFKKHSKEAINWARVGCDVAEHVEDSDGQSRDRVWLRKAAPNCGKLCLRVQEDLATAGFPDIEVISEW